jgi:urease accessory protein UreE
MAARLAWQIGNLHFPLEATAALIRVADDPALRQLFEREHIAFTSRTAVFRPFAHGHHH